MNYYYSDHTKAEAKPTSGGEASSSSEAASPCIYRELKECGKFYCIYHTDKSLLLTKNTAWEKVVLQKLNEWRVDQKFHQVVLMGTEVFAPMLVLFLFGFIFLRK